ncbi:doublecortin [Cystoisospora suis]|uniref:Doublecortin n=1 Tax=Cystoisospora suis TaxID=483139 RepID=A0A2C6L927_9APIC|nr:doublecortin [Cystoisospora suis]
MSTWKALAESGPIFQGGPAVKEYDYFPPPYPPCPPTIVTPLRTSAYDFPEAAFVGSSAAPRRLTGRRNVFERLTDSAYYTGSHRERFDEFGNGRGIAGREYLYAHDGLTESPSRSHEVYSSVVKKPFRPPLRAARKPVVTPGTLGVQRFGVQVAAPRLLWLYRNGDKHDDGTPFFVRPYIKSMEALYQQITKEITPIAGPVRRLLDQNFRVITDLEDIVDGAKYLCTSGEPPAPYDRLEKFLSEWVVQKSYTRVPSSLMR